jgi:hypothetical protein
MRLSSGVWAYRSTGSAASPREKLLAAMRIDALTGEQISKSAHYFHIE